MTTAEASPRPLSEDAAISAAVHALLEDRGESVSDLAYHTRISVASLYRKLGGQASWKAADVGVVARHYSLTPGDLFRGPDVTGGGRRLLDTAKGTSRPTREYSASERTAALLRRGGVRPAQALSNAA